MVSKIFILDANVLIDFAESDLRVLSLAANHLGQVSVASHLLGEVDQKEFTRETRNTSRRISSGASVPRFENWQPSKICPHEFQ